MTDDSNHDDPVSPHQWLFCESTQDRRDVAEKVALNVLTNGFLDHRAWFDTKDLREEARYVLDWLRDMKS